MACTTRLSIVAPLPPLKPKLIRLLSAGSADGVASDDSVTSRESEKKCGKARKLVNQPFKPLEQLALDTTAQRFHASRHRAPLS